VPRGALHSMSFSPFCPLTFSAKLVNLVTIVTLVTFVTTALVTTGIIVDPLCIFRTHFHGLFILLPPAWLTNRHLSSAETSRQRGAAATLFYIHSVVTLVTPVTLVTLVTLVNGQFSGI
jgi:hypothetical protein